MKTTTTTTTIFSNSYNSRTYAHIAGLSLLVMALTAIFAFAIVFNRLVVPDDAVATFNHLASNFALFSSGIVAWLVIMLTDLLVTWALYYYFKPVHKHLSLISSGFRLGYAILLGFAIYYQFSAAQLISSSLKNPLLNTTTLQNEVLQRVMTFEALWSFGLIIFGCHLIALSLLTLKSGTVPKWICYLLFAAGMSYMLIHSMNTFLPSYGALTSQIESVLGLPVALGELSFAVWLLIKGGKPFLDTTQ